MVTSGSLKLLAVEVDWARRRVLVFVVRADFVEHRHVVVLVLHAGPRLTLLAELLVLDAARLWPDFLLGLAGVSFRAADLGAVRVLTHLHHVRRRALDFLALPQVGVILILGLLRHHTHLSAHVTGLFLFHSVDAFHSDVSRLDVGIGPVVNGLLADDFVLHRGAQTAL